MDPQQTDIQALQHRIAFLEDMKAYEQLYGLLFDSLHRWARVFVKSSEVAEEIVSDVFIKLWQMRHRLREIDNLKVYCFTIARNLSYNYLVRHNKFVAQDIDSLSPEIFIEAGDPETRCITADILEKIKEAIRQLPPQCQLIFQLVKEEGMKYKEVAEILQISTLTVRNQVAIATRKIAQQLPPSMMNEVSFIRK